ISYILCCPLCRPSKETGVARDPDSEKSTSFTSLAGSPSGIYQPGWGVMNNCRLDTPEACQDVVDHSVPPRYFVELRHLPNLDFLGQYNMNLAWQVTIGSQLRLRRLKTWGGSHRKALFGLEVINAYDPEADTKFTTALQALKDLKYPLVYQLEQLKDAPIDLIIASLHLESDTGEDAPSFIRDLRPSSSQLKILVYPEVRDPKDPWAVKEEMLLEDVIAANVSRAEKKMKCQILFRTHRVGSVHHARSDGIPVFVPIVAPQGLQILLKDAAVQTEILEDESSLRLVRSKSLPMM
ncbi:hypothetical protein Tco_1084043, partial [Tanacetum coccineum]